MAVDALIQSAVLGQNGFAAQLEGGRHFTTINTPYLVCEFKFFDLLPVTKTRVDDLNGLANALSYPLISRNLGIGAN